MSSPRYVQTKPVYKHVLRLSSSTIKCLGQEKGSTQKNRRFDAVALAGSSMVGLSPDVQNTSLGVNKMASHDGLGLPVVNVDAYCVCWRVWVVWLAVRALDCVLELSFHDHGCFVTGLGDVGDPRPLATHSVKEHSPGRPRCHPSMPE